MFVTGSPFPPEHNSGCVIPEHGFHLERGREKDRFRFSLLQQTINLRTCTASTSAYKRRVSTYVLVPRNPQRTSTGTVRKDSSWMNLCSTELVIFYWVVLLQLEIHNIPNFCLFNHYHDAANILPTNSRTNLLTKSRR